MFVTEYVLKNKKLSAFIQLRNKTTKKKANFNQGDNVQS